MFLLRSQTDRECRFEKTLKRTNLKINLMIQRLIRMIFQKKLTNEIAYF